MERLSVFLSRFQRESIELTPVAKKLTKLMSHELTRGEISEIERGSSPWCMCWAFRITVSLIVSSLLHITGFRQIRAFRQIAWRRSKAFNEMSSSTHSVGELDRSLFDEDLRLVALRIPAKQCTQYMKVFKDFLFHRDDLLKLPKRIHPVEGNPEERILLLAENLTLGTDNEGGPILPSLPESLTAFLEKNTHTTTHKTIQLGYANVSVEAALKKVLPPDVDVPSSFEQCGHIAHLNLREEQLPYKKLIGQVILDKNIQNIRTVVNKVGEIKTEFRTFPLELLAGEENYNVKLRESGAQFKVRVWVRVSTNSSCATVLYERLFVLHLCYIYTSA